MTLSRDTRLRAIPRGVKGLKNITYLDLSGCNLSTDYSSDIRPADPLEALASLEKLEEFHLCRAQLTALPQSICTFTQLNSLDIAVNQLVCLPEELSQLRSLEFLFAGHNNFPAIPEVRGRPARPAVSSTAETDTSRRL